MPLKSRSQEDLLAGSRDEANVAMTLTSLLLLRPEGAGPHTETTVAEEPGNRTVIYDGDINFVIHVHMCVCVCVCVCVLR